MANLIAYFKCDENAANNVVLDTVSGQSSTGTASVNTNVLSTTEAKVGTAFQFTGTSTEFVQISSSASNIYAFSCWLVPQNLPLINNSGAGLHHAFTRNVDYGICITYATSGTAIQINGRFTSLSGTNAAQCVYLLTAGDIGKWHHFVSNLESGTPKMYLNGVFHNSGNGTLTGLQDKSTGTLNIGGANASNRMIAGTLDECKIHDATLSLSEIRALASLHTKGVNAPSFNGYIFKHPPKPINMWWEPQYTLHTLADGSLKKYNKGFILKGRMEWGSDGWIEQDDYSNIAAMYNQNTATALVFPKPNSDPTKYFRVQITNEFNFVPHQGDLQDNRQLYQGVIEFESSPGEITATCSNIF